MSKKDRSEFAYRMGKIVGMAERRQKMQKQVAELPQAVTDDREVNIILVSGDEYQAIFEAWWKLAEAAGDELRQIDDLISFVQTTGLRPPTKTMQGLSAVRTQCMQTLAIAGATISNLQASRDGLSMEAFYERRMEQLNAFPDDLEAGWHRDLTDRHQLRYYDGRLWSDHVSDDGVQSIDYF